ncbi:hypothetical protein NG2371_01880 [Nocardia gamkensis]|nr:hypothetical protein [Nocardia gamkensis]
MHRPHIRYLVMALLLVALTVALLVVAIRLWRGFGLASHADTTERCTRCGAYGGGTHCPQCSQDVRDRAQPMGAASVSRSSIADLVDHEPKPIVQRYGRPSSGTRNATPQPVIVEPLKLNTHRSMRWPADTKCPSCGSPRLPSMPPGPQRVLPQSPYCRRYPHVPAGWGTTCSCAQCSAAKPQLSPVSSTQRLGGPPAPSFTPPPGQTPEPVYRNPLLPDSYFLNPMLPRSTHIPSYDPPGGVYRNPMIPDSMHRNTMIPDSVYMNPMLQALGYHHPNPFIDRTLKRS